MTDTSGLMTQTEARQEAKRLQDKGIFAIAGAVPLNSWGGHEDGWTVYIGNPYAAAK